MARTYYFGNGVSKDLGTAMKWSLLAAEQGHPIAAYNVGYFLSGADGLPRDAIESLRWVIIACEQTKDLDEALGVSDDVRQRLCNMQVVLARKMTAAEIAKAQALARNWLDALRSRKP